MLVALGFVGLLTAYAAVMLIWFGDDPPELGEDDL
jgi:hypothetical protein